MINLSCKSFRPFTNPDGTRYECRCELNYKKQRNNFALYHKLMPVTYAPKKPEAKKG